MWRGVVAGTLLGLIVGCTPQPSPPAASRSPAPSSPTAAASAAATPPVDAGTRETGRRAIRYVALGDSLASGMGGKASYADAYRRALSRRTGRRVELTNLGRPGWTSSQLLQALRSDEQFRAAVASADVITWDIGGNDIIEAVLRSATGTCPNTDGGDGCIGGVAARFRVRWREILDELVELRRSADVPLLTFDLYTPFIPPAARTDELLGQLRSMNDTIHAADAQRSVAVAAVAEAFAGASGTRLLSRDGLHPSAAGHRLIASLLIDVDVSPKR